MEFFRFITAWSNLFVLTIPIWQICLDKKKVIKTAVELQIIHHIINIGAMFLCMFIMPHYFVRVPNLLFYIYFIFGWINLSALVTCWSWILLGFSSSLLKVTGQKKVLDSSTAGGQNQTEISEVSLNSLQEVDLMDKEMNTKTIESSNTPGEDKPTKDHENSLQKVNMLTNSTSEVKLNASNCEIESESRTIQEPLNSSTTKCQGRYVSRLESAPVNKLPRHNPPRYDANYQVSRKYKDRMKDPIPDHTRTERRPQRTPDKPRTKQLREPSAEITRMNKN